MLSESARMSSAAEARYRVSAPNSFPRTVKLVALDAAGEEVVRRLSLGAWKHARFYSAATFTRNLADEVATADLVIMVAGPGGLAQAATDVGRACSDRRVNTTALIVRADTAGDDQLARTLAQIRPWALMVVIANTDEYIDDMLVALRA
jgi:hypothetical protein